MNFVRKLVSSKRTEYFVSLLISIVAALVLGALIILITGKNPIEGYAALFQGVFGNKIGFFNMLAKSVVLIITGLAAAVAAKAGIFNVGGEGQLYLGALASAIVGYTFWDVSVPVAIALAFAAAMLAGGLYAFIPAFLKINLNINEVITTVMLNSVAIYFCGYLINGPLKTLDKGIASGTNAINPAFKFAKLVPQTSLTSSIFYCAIIALIVWYIMTKTTLGYDMKITGQNSRFARYSGLSTKSIMILSMMVSGALCGIAGMFEVYGNHGRFIENISKEFYFDGMLVAMIMRYEPAGIIFMSLFFGALKVGSNAMELSTGISSELISVIQAIIIFFMAAQGGLLKIAKDFLQRRKAAKTETKEMA